MFLADFDYRLHAATTFPGLDPTKIHRSRWYLKKYDLPFPLREPEAQRPGRGTLGVEILLHQFGDGRNHGLVIAGDRDL